MSRKYLITQSQCYELQEIAGVLLDKLSALISRERYACENHMRTVVDLLSSQTRSALENAIFFEGVKPEEFCAPKKEIMEELKIRSQHRKKMYHNYRDESSNLESSILKCSASDNRKRQALSLLFSLEDIVNYDPEKAPKALQNLNASSVAEDRTHELVKHNYKASGIALGGRSK